MIKLKVNLENRSYPIFITKDYKDIAKCITDLSNHTKCFIITDSNVEHLQLKELIEEIKKTGLDYYEYVILSGEKSKSLDTVKDIYNFLYQNKADRDSMLIALGGGVVGDITGFVASTFLRGISFVQVPTSLLAQVDSSVGGKVGVDFNGSKNIIGAFYQPKFVYINVSSLKTLPKRELISGIAEVIKHGLIKDLEFFDYVDYNVDRILTLDEDVLQYIIKINCQIKAGVVEQDETETGIRAILNFGHTVGHAIESCYDFELLHGECVALGMIAAFRISEKLRYVSKNETNKVINTLKKVGLPTTLDKMDIEKVYAQMFFDKKIKDNELMFVLPKGIGTVDVKRLDKHHTSIKEVLKEL